MPTHDKEAVLAGMAGRWPDFYGGYTELRRQGDEWRGPCPLHGGDGPNFAVDPEAGRWYCHSQCREGGDAFDFLHEREGLDFPEALSLLAGRAGVPAATARHTPPRPGPVGREAVAYDYTDGEGALLYQAVRFEPKGFRQRRPDGASGWVWGLGDTPRVLYRLPEVLAAVEKGRPVYVVEGEKDADALATLGLCATCNPMGAGKWQDAYSQDLTGASVALLPDNDAPGRDHAQAVARSLHCKARRIRVVELPGLPEKGDVSDWLAARRAEGMDDHSLRTALSERVRAAPDWEPPDRGEEEAKAIPGVAPAPATSGATLSVHTRKSIAARVVRAPDVGPPPPELPLLFGPYLNVGATHWLTGQTGLGKSTFAYNLCGALAEGAELWGLPCKKQRVLSLDMESGDLGRSLKLQRLYRDGRPPGDWLFATEPIRFPEELPDFLAYIRAEGVTFVVFDTARRCFSVRDENDNAEVYSRVIPTLDALKAAGVASLVMGHPAKNGNGSARGAGAQEDAGDVNLSLTMHQSEVGDEHGVIKLAITKNRLLGLGHEPLYLRRVGGHSDRFERVDAREAVQGQEPEESPGKREQCRAAILGLLSDRPGGHATHTEIMAAMRGRGFTDSTAKRAHKEAEQAGEIVRAPQDRFPQGGYCLPEPFAEEGSPG